MAERSRSRRKACRIARWLAAALLLWLLTLSLLIISFSRRGSRRPSDAIIVLGAAVQGGRPSPVFAARLDHAIELQRNGVGRFLVLTGGVGEGDAISESQAGAEYALARGVPREQILTESISQTTRQNLVQARGLLSEHGLKTGLLVSDPLHMRRACMMAADLGIDVESAPTSTTRYQSWRSRFTFLLRELYFYHHYLAFSE